MLKIRMLRYIILWRNFARQWRRNEIRLEHKYKDHALSGVRIRIYSGFSAEIGAQGLFLTGYLFFCRTHFDNFLLILPLLVEKMLYYH